MTFDNGEIPPTSGSGLARGEAGAKLSEEREAVGLERAALLFFLSSQPPPPHPYIALPVIHKLFFRDGCHVIHSCERAFNRNSTTAKHTEA